MTAPRASRHDDRRRTFPALPSRPGAADEGDFAASWWGNAWVESMEDVALDPARLRRGRAYASGGHVDAITVTPGRVMAYVHGSRPRPYRTEIRLRTLGDGAWEDLLDAAAARPDHIAALLDKDMPQALAATADLLPTAGDLTPDCSCPDDGFPCKHAAALCYQTARLLDEDPFVLFLMRGRGEHEILADLTRRNATRSAAERTTAAPPMPTVDAATALTPRPARPLPPPFPLPANPGRPPVYPHTPGAPDPLALDLLATEAAARAHTFLATGIDPVAGLTPGRTPSGWPPPTPAPASPPPPAPSTATSRRAPTTAPWTWHAPSPPGARAASRACPSWRSPGTRRPARSTGPAPPS